MAFSKFLGFGRYSYDIHAGSSPPSDGTQSRGENSYRISEERKSTSSSADRNHDRFRNAQFKFPEPFNPKTHVRLLRITGIDKFRVEGNFKSVAIDQLPSIPYSALSYTWGTANTDQDVHEIRLCGQKFYVRDNLWKFFNKTRAQWKGCYLYVDAICIDQRSTYERTDQVRLMSEIYRHANRVCTWLGAPYDGEHRRELAAFSDRLARDKLGRSWKPDALFGLAHLCSRIYWNRLWVVQEVLLADNITIMYGKLRFDWDDLARLQRSIDETEVTMDQTLGFWSAWVFDPPTASVHRTHADEHIGHGWQGGWRMIYRRSAWKSASTGRYDPRKAALRHAARHGFTLYQAISYFSRQQCRDPRDKVFALLGLLEPAERDAIEPNYESSAETVYRQALKVGLRALQRDVEPQALAEGQYPDDRYQDFAANLRNILHLRKKDVEGHTNDAFRCKTFRDTFVRNCQREQGLNWAANSPKSLAEVESNIIHGFLDLTEHEQSSRKAFGLLVDIKGRLHLTSSALTAARSGLFNKTKFSQAPGKQSVAYRWTATAAQLWTRATHWKKWQPFRG